MDAWRHLRRPMKVERQALHDDQTSRDDAVSSGGFISNRTNAT